MKRPAFLLAALVLLALLGAGVALWSSRAPDVDASLTRAETLPTRRDEPRMEPVLEAARETRTSSEAIELQREPHVNGGADIALADAPPTTGACVVRVQHADGRLYEDEVSVSLEKIVGTISRRERPEPSRLHGVRGGIARFDRVEPGLWLQASVQRDGSPVAHFAQGSGPAAAGEEAVLVVTLGATVPVFAGRALDAEGNVLADATLGARVHPHDWNTAVEDTTNVRTDGEGRFEVDHRAHDTRPLQLTVYRLDGNGVERASATRDLPHDAAPGVHALGDFVLQPSPLLASGTVVDGAGVPVAAALVRVHVSRTDEWEEVATPRVHSDAQGRFELRAHLATPQVRLQASIDGNWGRPEVVVPGTSGVVLSVAASGTIAGRVLLDPDVPPDALRVRAILESAASSPDTHGPPTKLDADGSFELVDLREGTFRVLFWTATESRSVAQVEGVRVRSGEVTRDARLDPLDLRGALLAFTLEIVDEQGAPIPRGEVHSRPTASPDQRMTAAGFQDGRHELVGAHGPLDLVVLAADRRRVRLEAVASDQRVVMRPGIEVLLTLSPEVRPPEPPWFLGVCLVPVEEGVGRQVYLGRTDGTFDADGRLVMRAPATGPVEVRFTLAHQSPEFSAKTYFPPDVPIVLQIADNDVRQAFVIRLDPEEYAIARMNLGGD